MKNRKIIGRSEIARLFSNEIGVSVSESRIFVSKIVNSMRLTLKESGRLKLPFFGKLKIFYKQGKSCSLSSYAVASVIYYPSRAIKCLTNRSG